jgi:hypothetical protein
MNSQVIAIGFWHLWPNRNFLFWCLSSRRLRWHKGTPCSMPEKAEYAHFLESGLASVVTTVQSGSSVEVGVVGKEGVIGLPVLLGTESLPNRTFIQIPGTGFRIKAGYLQEAFERPGTLRQKLQRFLQIHLVQASQTAACNRLHENCRTAFTLALDVPGQNRIRRLGDHASITCRHVRHSTLNCHAGCPDASKSWIDRLLTRPYPNPESQRSRGICL